MQQPSLILNARTRRSRPVTFSMAGPINGNHAITRREGLDDSELKVFDASCVSVNHYYRGSPATFDVVHTQPLDRDKVLLDCRRRLCAGREAQPGCEKQNDHQGFRRGHLHAIEDLKLLTLLFDPGET